MSMIKTVAQYNEEKKEFFEKHQYDYMVETSSMDQYGVYTKNYNFVDGAQWYERMAPVVEQRELFVNFVVVKVKIELLETEYWSNESTTYKYYEKM